MVSLLTRCHFTALYFTIFINADISKYDNCIISNNQLKFPILPGMGWDNFENREMGKVLNLKFSTCKFSDDNKYLIPDQVSIYPVRFSVEERHSESFDHFMNYSSTTSKSMKFEGEISFMGIKLGGQFSDENEKIKKYQLRTRSKFVRVQQRYSFYKSLSEPDTSLHPNFMDRITQLANWIIHYNETFYPSYLADMIVRDFGTHVIRSIDVGATLLKVDFLSSAFVKILNSRRINIEDISTASFFNHFKIDMTNRMRFTEKQINEYNTNLVETISEAYGGFLNGNDKNFNKWVASLDEKLVAIDRRGDLIYHILNKKVLPHLSNDIIHKVSDFLMESVERYYNANSRKGCLDMNSPNFNSDANIDGGNCIKPTVYFRFGGVFTECSGPSDQCNRVWRSNSLTGSYSCPNGFSYSLLNEGLNACQSYCYTYLIFFTHCDTKCSYFKLYWCYPLTNSPNHNGYRFGGFIDSQMPFCPNGFFPIDFTDATQLCVTTDASAKNSHAIDFGGFYSCRVGNPLTVSSFKNENNNAGSYINFAEYWRHDCPDGYVAHIATIDRNCQISYCTESNKITLGKSPDLKRPPFFKVSFTSNGTTSKILYNKNGEMFIVNLNFNLFSKLYANKTENSIYGILFGCSLGVMVILIACFIVYRLRKRKRMQMNKNVNNSQVLNEKELQNVKISTIQ